MGNTVIPSSPLIIPKLYMNNPAGSAMDISIILQVNRETPSQ